MKANFAGLLLGQGRTREAKELLQSSLAVWESGGARNEVYIGQARLSLATAEIFDDRPAQAEAVARDALANFEGETSEPHPDVARALGVLGTSLQMQGRTDEAARALTRAHHIGKTTLVQDHDDMATILTELGIVRLAQGNAEEARASFEQALSIRTTRPGLPTELPRLRFAMARALVEEDPERALRLARTSKAGFQALPLEHPMRRVLNDVDAWIARHATPATPPTPPPAG